MSGEWADLCTLVVLTNADSTLAVDTVSPETTDLKLSLGDALVGEEEPGTDNGLGQDVEDGIGNDLVVNANVAGAIGNTPDAGSSVSGEQNRS